MLPYAGDKTGIYGIFAAIASFVTLSITAVVKFFKRKWEPDSLCTAKAVGEV